MSTTDTTNTLPTPPPPDIETDTHVHWEVSYGIVGTSGHGLAVLHNYERVLDHVGLLRGSRRNQNIRVEEVTKTVVRKRVEL